MGLFQGSSGTFISGLQKTKTRETDLETKIRYIIDVGI